MAQGLPSQHVDGLRKFIERFQSQLGRRDRLSACHAYLTDLLTRHDSAKESVASSTTVPNAVRQFVNRSPWNDEAIMSGLRALLFDHGQDATGVLVLTEINIPKKGRHSVGVRMQSAKDQKGSLFTPDKNCQCVVMWLWATNIRAWPVAARLYLPQNWTWDTPRTKSAGIPDRFLCYQEKSRIALDLLDAIQAQIKSPCTLVIDRTYMDNPAPLMDELDRRSLHYLVATDHPKLLPHRTVEYRIKTSHKEWIRELAFLWFLNDLERNLKPTQRTGGDYMFLVAKDKKVKSHSGQRSQKQFIFCHRERKRHINLYITNRMDENSGAHYLAMIEKLKTTRRTCSDLLNIGGLRRFEGRTWRGFHHHITLCFIAYYFSHKQSACG